MVIFMHIFLQPSVIFLRMETVHNDEKKKEYCISINFKTLNFKEIIVKLNKIQLGNCYQKVRPVLFERLQRH